MTQDDSLSRPDGFKPEYYPSDWLHVLNWRGYTRAKQHRHYVVQLSVLGKQRSIATTTTSQRHAAFLYDLALWKLAHFLTRRLRPNFPDAFEALTQAVVDNECPSLNWLYDACVASSGPFGDSTERELREAALEANKTTAVSTGGNSETFGRYRQQVDKTRAQSLAQVTRLTALRHMLTLNKLPEVARIATEYETLLNQSEVKAKELQTVLATHEDFYQKMLYETN